jgi:hypothetical protein
MQLPLKQRVQGSKSCFTTAHITRCRHRMNNGLRSG